MAGPADAPEQALLLVLSVFLSPKRMQWYPFTRTSHVLSPRYTLARLLMRLFTIETVYLVEE